MVSEFDSSARATQVNAFLQAAGWADAARIPLDQDASTRRYVRLVRGSDTVLLMDAPSVEDAPCPPGADASTRLAMGWNAQTRLAASRVDAFVALAAHLQSLGLSAPDILAHDSEAGFALLEDFGTDQEFARLIERGDAHEVALYTAAAETLAAAHAAGAPSAVTGYGERWPILDFDQVALRANADLFAEWLPQFDVRMASSDKMLARWEAVRDTLIDQATAFPRGFTLRDYHAENLIWLPGREGIARVGLLDFQDAVRGWDAWDLAMLTQDARRPVSAEASEAAITTYLAAMGNDRQAFDERLAVIGALNALRITGLFARLVQRDKKNRYLAFMPRQQALLARNLSHPATAGLAGFIRENAPFILEASAE